MVRKGRKVFNIKVNKITVQLLWMNSTCWQKKLLMHLKTVMQEIGQCKQKIEAKK
jgi:hypothetical protein